MHIAFTEYVETAQNLYYILKTEHKNTEYHPNFPSSALDNKQVDIFLKQRVDIQ